MLADVRLGRDVGSCHSGQAFHPYENLIHLHVLACLLSNLILKLKGCAAEIALKGHKATWKSKVRVGVKGILCVVSFLFRKRIHLLGVLSIAHN